MYFIYSTLHNMFTTLSNDAMRFDPSAQEKCFGIGNCFTFVTLDQYRTKTCVVYSVSYKLPKYLHECT